MKESRLGLHQVITLAGFALLLSCSRPGVEPKSAQPQTPSSEVPRNLPTFPPIPSPTTPKLESSPSPTTPIFEPILTPTPLRVGIEPTSIPTILPSSTTVLKTILEPGTDKPNFEIFIYSNNATVEVVDINRRRQRWDLDGRDEIRKGISYLSQVRHCRIPNLADVLNEVNSVLNKFKDRRAVTVENPECLN